MGEAPRARGVRSLVLGFLLALLPGAGGGETLSLAPRLEAGDVYTLSLRTAIQTEATTETGRGEALEEDVEIVYRARVEVLEVGEDGAPLRERHRDVELTLERPEGGSPYFGDETAYEVRRGEEGLQVFAGGRRVDPEVERVVARALADQFEHGAAPALFAPKGDVEPGDTWPLEPALTRRFLEARGIRAQKLGEGATATLAVPEGSAGERVVRYAIPVSWFELAEMPPNSTAQASDGRVEGEIRVPAGASALPLRHSSRLRIRIKGVTSLSGLPGRGETSSWQLETVRTTEQRSAAGEGAASTPE